MKSVKIAGITLLALLSVPVFASVEVQAKANGATCKKGYLCVLTGSHYVKIVNESEQDRNYHYRYSLCADNGDCVKHEKDFSVPAHQSFENRWDNKVETRFMVAMQHTNYAQTEITGFEKKFTDNIGYVSVQY